ncbi:MAG: GDP-mannose 4,6-dehydratase, partial [Alphaproteobacteria bacterium]|nr:GDP-mannose 4,6-dehydratase [Alphaproteobacteria bacterium]
LPAGNKGLPAGNKGLPAGNKGLPAGRQFRFIHVSTDEVYGTLKEEDAAFTENSPYRPNSPYSASKASSDLLVRAWVHSYQFPAIITHCSNNYGTRQHSEKLIPTIVRNALQGNPIPIYGNGRNIRDWLHVKDHCAGLYLSYQKGEIGETYCFGGNNEWRNIELAKKICALLDEIAPKDTEYHQQLNFVEDRKGHDWRYAIDSTKAKQRLGFTPNNRHDAFLREVVKFYCQQPQMQDNNVDEDLSKTKILDFKTTKFSYETHQELAKNPHLSGHERVGFPNHYREGRDGFIVEDITVKLKFTDNQYGKLLDIGCGASSVTNLLLEQCHQSYIDAVLNDSPEMLANIDSKREYKKIAGRFPLVFDECMKYAPQGYDMILSYSVLQLVHSSGGNIFDFLDAIMSALKVGGIALLGDIPNQSKRKRFFSNETGIAFHQSYTKTNETPIVQHYQVERGIISDGMLQALVSYAHSAGCDAYILPQAKNLPFANRRDDLMIQKL